MRPPASDWLDDVVDLVAATANRFPAHNGAFHLVARLAEESGELAQCVNHLEGMGRKTERHGPADVEDLTKEVLDVARCAIALAVHYGCLDELRALTREKLASYRARGWSS